MKPIVVLPGRSRTYVLEPLEPSPRARAVERLAEAGLRGPCVVVLPRSLCLFREFEIPGGTPEEIEGMVRLRLERELPVPVAQVRYGYVAHPAKGGQLAVRAVAVRREDWGPIEAELVKAGLKPVGAVAAVSCLAGMGVPAAAWELPDGVEVALFAEGVPVAGKWLESMDRLEAEWPRIVGAAKQRRPEVEWGEAARLARGSQAAANGLPAELRPLAHALSAWGREPDVLAPPARTPFVRRHRAKFIAGGVAAALALAVLGVRWDLASRRSDVEQLRRELAMLKPEVDRIVEMERRVTTARAWAEDRFFWSAVAVVMTEGKGLAEPYPLYFKITTYSEREGTVTATGQARGDQQLDEFLQKLREHGGFESVRTTSRQRQEQQREFPILFTMEAKVRGEEWR